MSVVDRNRGRVPTDIPTCLPPFRRQFDQVRLTAASSSFSPNAGIEITRP